MAYIQLLELLPVQQTRTKGSSYYTGNINPLVHSIQYIRRLTKILEGILKKISYERHDYESVDEKSLS